jgi:hypothetical protein
MIRFFSLFLILFSFTMASDRLELANLQTTMLEQKGHTPVEVTLSLVIKGRDVSMQRDALMDVVQTALGSLWAETLVTAEGKAAFKKKVIALADRQYGIGVEFVFIENVRVATDTLTRCLELMERQGFKRMRSKP